MRGWVTIHASFESTVSWPWWPLFFWCCLWVLAVRVRAPALMKPPCLPSWRRLKICVRLLPCAEVFPGASIFLNARASRPLSRPTTATGPNKKLLGYVMLSTDITDTPAYSGKPVVTLIGMDLTGRFVGVKVLKHSEPILLLGIPESALLNFNNQYIGKSVAQNIEVGQSRPEENILGLDAISGRHGDSDCTKPGHDDTDRARCRPVCRNPQILHLG
jgi:transcriptional regulator of nitric oxide reductase